MTVIVRRRKQYCRPTLTSPRASAQQQQGSRQGQGQQYKRPVDDQCCYYFPFDHCFWLDRDIRRVAPDICLAPSDDGGGIGRRRLLWMELTPMPFPELTTYKKIGCVVGR